MQRRGGSGQPVKGQSVNRPKARKAPTALESTADLQEQVAALTHELKEAREQRVATADVLKVISRSPTDVQPVFDMIAESAARLCEAQFCFVYRFDGQLLHFVAHHSLTPEVLEINRRAFPAPPSRMNAAARSILERGLVQIPDVNADPDYALGAMAVAGGYRSAAAVPILRDGLPIGSIAITRAQAGLLPNRQIELLKTFAEQAAIAIENVRLFNETKESLEQQTATSEVLKVISSSPGDLQPVFDAILANATDLCGARFASLRLSEGDQFRTVSLYNAPAALVEHWRSTPLVRPHPESALGRTALTKQVVQIDDVRKGAAYNKRDPLVVAGVDLGGYRTVLTVPMLKEDVLIGVISIYRQEVKAFTDKQIELVKNFASQAVIAIENTRLLNELRESLQQQTATADVLKVISSSPGDLRPVFEAMLENATRVCDAKFGILFRYEGGLFHSAASLDVPPAFTDFLDKQGSFAPKPGQLFGRLCQSKKVIHELDRATDPDPSPSVRYGGARTSIAVPMLKESELIGAFFIYRTEVRPFTDKQIELVKNFAAQAVIAIENTRLLNELRQRTDDLTELLEQQMASSNVLRVISSSPTNVQPVFDSIAESAVRLCDGQFSFVLRFDGKVMDFASCCGLSAEGLDAFHSILPMPASEDTAAGRAIVRRAVVEIPDVEADPSYGARGRGLAKAVTYRSIAAVPLLNEGNPIGAIAVARANAGSFPKRQIVLLQAFADQAVIAIKNVRLFDEVQARTRDLSEALQQQTATADVLKVISSSPGDLEPVFDALLTNAMQVCDAKFGFMYRASDTDMKIMAHKCDVPAYLEFAQKARFTPQTIVGRVAETKQVIQVVDIAATQRYADREPLAVAAVEIGRVRTILGVPLLKDNEVKGAILLYRQEVRPFTDKQIELVQNFAAQAVIAIENTRLLSELRQRTDDLSESLEQQTATSEVLQVISRSAGELQPVFDTMLENAVRICGAKFGNLLLVEGDAYRHVALYGAPQAFLEERRRNPVIHPRPGSDLDRVRTTKQIIHIADMQVGGAATTAIVELAGARTFLDVPMLKDGELIGTIGIYRQHVQPFTDKQIELVKNFAAQAVIAIENTRLLNELRELLQQQTATADVLKVISSSPGELDPVFQALLENAVRICGAKFGNLFLCEGDALRVVALHGAPQAYVEERQRNPVIRPGPKTTLGRAMTTKQPVQIADIQNYKPDSSDDTGAGTTGVKLVRLAGARTVLAVPMVKESELVGAIVIYRQEVRPFTEKQIELVQNFAAQAVIAIENTRLLSELRESLQQQTATSEVLKVISRSTFDLQMVLNTLVELAARLCEAENANIWQPKGEGYRMAASYNENPKTKEFFESISIEAGRGTIVGRSLLEKKTVHVHDVQTDPNYTLVRARELGSFRTVLAVPMLREGVAIGVLALTRREMRPFTDKQIELVTTFADQAAIAIENVRLFESVEARTRELAASLENLRTTQDRLVQTQKLASLGQLTAGIAHEIKNPLNFVNNFSGVSAELIDELQEALKDVSLNEKRRKEINELTNMLRGNLDKVVQHGKRADAIVKNMLLHSREGSGEHRLVDINAIVEESLNLAYHGARAEKQGFTITLEQSLDPAAGAADVFPQDITRALLNLISNGFYAATKRKAETNGGDYEPTLAAATKNLGDRVEIRIRDNGTGIPPEVKEKMFNPFFTTKPAGEGTGLGLSISHDIIVKQHGGSIEVDTHPGEFTEIRIILPRAAVFAQ